MRKGKTSVQTKSTAAVPVADGTARWLSGDSGAHLILHVTLDRNPEDGAFHAKVFTCKVKCGRTNATLARASVDLANYANIDESNAENSPRGLERSYATTLDFFGDGAGRQWNASRPPSWSRRWITPRRVALGEALAPEERAASEPGRILGQRRRQRRRQPRAGRSVAGGYTGIRVGFQARGGDPRPRVEKSPPRRTSRSWTTSARTTMFRRRPRFETLRDPLRSARKTTTTNRGPRRTRERNPTRTPPRPVCAGRAPPWRSAFRRPHRRDRRRRNRSTATTTDRFPTANARSPCSVCTRRPRRRTRLGRAPRSSVPGGGEKDPRRRSVRGRFRGERLRVGFRRGARRLPQSAGRAQRRAGRRVGGESGNLRERHGADATPPVRRR